jgi:hypothetical protein
LKVGSHEPTPTVNAEVTKVSSTESQTTQNEVASNSPELQKVTQQFSDKGKAQIKAEAAFPAQARAAELQSLVDSYAQKSGEINPGSISNPATPEVNKGMEDTGKLQVGPGKEIDNMKDGDKVNQLQVAPATPQSAPPKPPSMVDRMTKAGMKNVGDPATEADLRNYYQNHAPAHDLIAKGDYRAAAAKYRELKNTDASSFSTHEKTEQQLNMAGAMKERGVKNLQFPPTEQNAKDYFKSLGASKPPLSNRAILNEFQNYTRSFYHHEGRDIVYKEKSKSEGGQAVKTRAPESWSEITDERKMYPQGTRKIDCEGYSYLAKELLGQAGFKNGKFVVVGPKNDPNTPEDESTKAHVMFTAERDNEVAIVSNDRALNGPRKERSDLLDRGYPQARGGDRAEDSVAWKATRKYENMPSS